VTGAVRLRARTRIQVSVEVSLAQTDVDAATGDAATRGVKNEPSSSTRLTSQQVIDQPER
jgi:hypothetical protein